MTFVLDTDIVDLAFHSQTSVLRKIDEHPAESVWVSIVAVEEIMFGAVSAINTTLSRKGAVQKNYDFLYQQFDYLRAFRVLPYTQEADLIYRTFSAATTKNRKRDCRLAAIALSKGWVVVTRNVRHFEDLVPVENWAD